MTHADVPQYDPIKAAWNTVATYSTYDEAQDAVNRLNAEGFPIENLDIVGSDLRLVERVTGPANKLRAVGNGALNGGALGGFLGLVMGLFSAGFTWLGMMVMGAVIGATWGAGFGFASHAFAGSRKTFASTRGLVATHYDLVARGGHTEQARLLLASTNL
ncbi:general stress protein [Phytoactinopolyspora endophytica]|uniref:general stress protein n=1 Tax=Phytoactinopolyspora endophytica TaxID=1642495 RepID=UPI00101BC9CF|nr:general stress protein [Phytoactinopolyspora endophytica]